MYEFHGWVKLAESPREVDQGSLDIKVGELNEFIKEVNWSSGFARLELMNGFYLVIVHGIVNRRRDEAEDLAELVNLVISKFSGAYGLIYELDDEIEVEGGFGSYTINVIRRGSCELQSDSFLTPIVPKVEGED